MTKRAKALELALALYGFYRTIKASPREGWQTYSFYGNGRVLHFSRPEEIQAQYRKIVENALK